MRRRKNGQNDSDISDSGSEDSHSLDSSYGQVAASKRKPGRPPNRNKRQRLQSDSDDNTSPQPSTSHNRIDLGSSNEDSESESGSETPDSDCPNAVERSLAKKKVAKKRGRPTKTASNVSQKKVQNGNTSKTSRKQGLNTSKKNTSRLSNCNGVSFDSKVVEPLAHKCVYFLLIEDQKKYPIRRKAIQTHVFKDEDYSPKLYLAVINKANKILQKTYGMELIELENQKDSYMIINILRRELGIDDYIEVSRTKQQQNGLILYLLTVIYMNDNVITEAELTKALKALDIDLTTKRLHPVFGDIKKYITIELVRQMYLNYECVSKDPPKHEITWGLRAEQEFSKKDLLQFACQIMDDTSPEDWKTQFKDAQEK